LIKGKKNKYDDLVTSLNKQFNLNITKDQMRWHINKKNLNPDDLNNSLQDLNIDTLTLDHSEGT
jgi:hypothetical protein